ncbi:hypothetical protein [Ktedonobacter sp. SOSP1-52]|uniref:hypothetical protein n=1 Tax=Ktedonobacter sp. SOSP1-52 TaxID=2778366 RepID=UPI001F2FA051|nr:hypothetical protein [Ktedonobacter sp. SOSP1-52]
MPITIWLGSASKRLSLSSHLFQPSLVLAKVVGLTTMLLLGRVMHPEQDWLPMSIPQMYLISALSTEEEVGVVSIAHLVFLTSPSLGLPSGASFHRDQQARIPTHQSERQLILDRQSDSSGCLSRHRRLLQQAS